MFDKEGSPGFLFNRHRPAVSVVLKQNAMGRESLMTLAVAIDNCVLSHCVSSTLTPEQKKDAEAFKEMISLAEQKIIELGGVWTSLRIENLAKQGKSRRRVKCLEKIIKDWPAIGNKRTQQQICCLHEILQDRNGYDSKQIVNNSRFSHYFVTMDYKIHKRYSDRRTDIESKCHTHVSVMRPFEFIEDYKAGKIPWTD